LPINLLTLTYQPAGMKKFSLAITALALLSFNLAAQHKLVKKWETDSALKVPESVLYDAKDHLLYVSNIDGKDPGAKDGIGSVGKVGLDGKIIKVDWVTGLNSPKGLGMFGDMLYVADVDQVAVIDTKKAAIVQKIPVPGAVFLNDITVDKNGIVYVSDTRNNKVYRIEKANVTTYLENMTGANGVLADGDDLYVLCSGTLYKADKNKKLTKVADGMENSTDGLEHADSKDFIVTAWAGSIWYVKADGTKEHLLDTQALKINSADIGYDPKNRIVYVPTFWRNSIVAYELK